MHGLKCRRLGSGVLLATEKARALVARNIEKLADREGFSKAGLARHLDVAQQMVSRWLKGKTLPTQYLDEIADYFQVPVKQLFEDDEEKQSPKAPPRPVVLKAEITDEEALRHISKSLGFQRISLKK